MPAELSKGWLDPRVPERQWTAFSPLLRDMYAGKPREDFLALARSVEMTGLTNPLILEVGCGSGWNGEVLAYLLRRPIRYIGLDYSYTMAAHGHRRYPASRFVVGDATLLPIRDSCCDILISGTVLMHLVGYRDAIREGRRATREWCILHTVPVVRARPTTYLQKLAYGSPVVEVIYNEQELLELIRGNGMRIREVLECYSYDLSDLLKEATQNRTYVCETV